MEMAAFIATLEKPKARKPVVAPVVSLNDVDRAGRAAIVETFRMAHGANAGYAFRAQVAGHALHAFINAPTKVNRENLVKAFQSLPANLTGDFFTEVGRV